MDDVNDAELKSMISALELDNKFVEGFCCSGGGESIRCWDGIISPGSLVVYSIFDIILVVRHIDIVAECVFVALPGENKGYWTNSIYLDMIKDASLVDLAVAKIKESKRGRKE